MSIIFTIWQHCFYVVHKLPDTCKYFKPMLSHYWSLWMQYCPNRCLQAALEAHFIASDRKQGEFVIENWRANCQEFPNWGPDLHGREGEGCLPRTHRSDSLNQGKTIIQTISSLKKFPLFEKKCNFNLKLANNICSLNQGNFFHVACLSETFPWFKASFLYVRALFFLYLCSHSCWYYERMQCPHYRKHSILEQYSHNTGIVPRFLITINPYLWTPI